MLFWVTRIKQGQNCFNISVKYMIANMVILNMCIKIKVITSLSCCFFVILLKSIKKKKLNKKFPFCFDSKTQERA